MFNSPDIGCLCVTPLRCALQAIDYQFKIFLKS